MSFFADICVLLPSGGRNKNNDQNHSGGGIGNNLADGHRLQAVQISQQNQQWGHGKAFVDNGVGQRELPTAQSLENRTADLLNAIAPEVLDSVEMV